jgi:hypothetical protein
LRTPARYRLSEIPAIESLNARFRQATPGAATSDGQAALKVIYLVIAIPQKNRANVAGRTPGWILTVFEVIRPLAASLPARR